MSADWKESPLKRAELAGITAIGVPVIAALGSSLSWKAEGLEHLHFEGNGRRPIMAFWHGRVLTATYFFRNRGIVVMISENFDGEWIARIIQQFGFHTSRGSTSRGGHRALLQLKRDMAQGRPVLGAGLDLDPAKERFVSTCEYDSGSWANQLITRNYRAPYVVPEQV